MHNRLFLFVTLLPLTVAAQSPARSEATRPITFLDRQLQRAPVFVGMAERRKDALSYAEIGLAVMRALHGI